MTPPTSDAPPASDSDLSARRLNITLALALLVLCIVVRGAFLIGTRGADPSFEGDEASYHYIAASAVAGTGWQTKEGYLSYRPPMLSLLLAGIYEVVGPQSRVGFYLMVLIGSLMAPMIFLGGPRWFGITRSSALLAALFWAFYPPSIYMSAQLLTENLGAVLAFASTLLYLRAAKSGTIVDALTTGLVWGLLAQTRPNFLLLPFSIVIFGLLFSPWLGARVWRPVQAGVATAVVMAVLMPWILRNYHHHGVFLPSTSMGGVLMPMCNLDLEDERVQAGAYRPLPRTEAILELPEAQWNAVGMQMTREYLADNWKKLPGPVIQRAKNFWTFRPDPFDAGFSKNDMVMAVVWLPILALFAVSLVRCSWFDSWLPLLIIAYTFSITLPFWGTPRFRFPVDGLILMQALLAWDSLNLRGRSSLLAGIMDFVDRRLDPTSTQPVQAG
jgi:hypothetical protein